VTEEEARELCRSRVAAMTVLREFVMPAPDAAPAEFHASLLDMRARLDEAEPLKRGAVRLLASVKAAAKAYGQAADDAADAELARLGRQAVRRDFEGVAERLAATRLATLPQRRAARAAERVADIAAATEADITEMYWGMRGIREELLDSLRYLAWEAAMER
jgi:hypothetical protein